MSVCFSVCVVLFVLLIGIECEDWVLVVATDICLSVLRRPGGDLLSHALRRSTIGAEGFHGRVRDGIGCLPPRHDHQAVEGQGVRCQLSGDRCQWGTDLGIGLVLERLLVCPAGWCWVFAAARGGIFSCQFSDVGCQ